MEQRLEKTVAAARQQRERDAATRRALVAAMMKDAQAGSLAAHYWLACEYTRARALDTALPLDAGKGMFHLRRCVEGGHADGALRLAALYASVAPVPGYDLDQARALTERAAELGSGQAKEALERCRTGQSDLGALLHQAVPLSWGSAVQAPAGFAESGFAPHPAMSRQFSLERGPWHHQQRPGHVGAYEVLVDGAVHGARWDGQDLTMDGAALPAGTPWRGLAHDPDRPHVSHVDAPGALLPGVAIGGYVAHDDPLSPRVHTIHVAKQARAKDGEPLTMCGHRARPGVSLRLWSESARIKVVDGERPELCALCAAATFVPATVVPSTIAPTAIVPAKDAPAPAPREAAAPAGQVLPARACYVGGIGYDNWDTGSTATRFELLGDAAIAVELISKVDEAGVPPSRLAAIATRAAASSSYTTGMRALTTPAGDPHPYGRGALEFAIVHLDADIVKIEGAWQDENGARYPFLAILQRAADLY